MIPKSKKQLIVVLISTLCFMTVFAQETVEDVGIAFLNVMKSDDLTQIKTMIPNTDVLIDYSESLGMNKSKEEKDDFIAQYAEEVNKYINRLTILKEEGAKIGIKWDTVKYVKLETEEEETILEEEQGKPLLMTGLKVIFSSGETLYKLYINTVFEHKGKLYLTGGRPELQEH